MPPKTDWSKRAAELEEQAAIAKERAKLQKMVDKAEANKAKPKKKSSAPKKTTTTKAETKKKAKAPKALTMPNVIFMMPSLPPAGSSAKMTLMPAPRVTEP
jgi:hypothetical protein